MLRRSSVFAAEVFDRSPTDKELVSQAKALCRDYIHSRLNRAGIGWSKPSTGWRRQVARWGRSLRCSSGSVSFQYGMLNRTKPEKLHHCIDLRHRHRPELFKWRPGGQRRSKGDELEYLRPNVYRNVARQLNITVASESVVSDAFLAVAADIFSTGVTWGKVVSLYAVAGD
ncbi:hypothetical protein WMY93_024335 [Mugilogobius chulae]|uniref:Bcl-2 Bcl-2 homology region 1-3 domain-containing protein n=1 Tax=Mugilogobius chulae TaxID=88201 RepID=A0AAW0MZB8_9GOBI